MDASAPETARPEASPATPLVARLVRLCCGRAWLVAAMGFAATVACAWFVAQNFNMSTDTSALISPNVPWRQAEARFARSFPDAGDVIAVVVDGKTPELAERAAADLTATLQPRGDLFKSVTRPDGGAFFNKEGLLFSSPAEVRKTTEQLIAAQPFLGPLAADPSLRGVSTVLTAAATGVSQGQARLSDLQAPLKGLGNATQQVIDGKPAFFSWRTLITGGKANPQELRRFITVSPKLNYTELKPGEPATDAIRAAARALKLTPENGVTIRLTGGVPMSDEEFGSLEESGGPVAIAMLVALVAMLWLAVRSPKIIACIIATVVAGLALTAAFGLALYGRFNLISVAFIALFVGLGVDFAIQYSVRYRADRLSHPELKSALAAAGGDVGGALALAAAATGIGFFAFLPTSYVGVSELGMIAGVGMGVAFLLSVTLLPALLTLARPGGEAEDVGFKRLAAADDFQASRRRAVLRGFAAAAGVCALLTPLAYTNLDFDPVNLRSPRSEAVATYRDLSANPDTTGNTLDALAPDAAAARSLSERLGRLPQVDKALSLESFVPEDQAPKLALIADANSLLDPTLNPFEVAPPPADAELVASLREGAAALRGAAAADRTSARADAIRVAALFERLASGSPQVRARAQAVLTSGLPTLLGQLRTTLTAEPVTVDTLPAEMKAQWIGRDGRHRLQVFPKGDPNDRGTLDRFVKAVRTVAPDVTGPPISIKASGNTIMGAFAQAGLLSLVVITALLFAVLRRPRHVALTLAPVLLTGLLTIGSIVVLRIPINFENVISMPLLLGIGVAFNIYYVMAWRNGATRLLESSLTRAVVFSALTTATSFGSLALSSHPGTASMGWLLMLSLFWVLVVALGFTPALLGPPPAARAVAD